MTTAPTTKAANPIESLANGAPPRLTTVIGVTAKVVGGLAAAHLASAQSYDGTQAFTIGVLTLVLVSLVPFKGGVGFLVASAGAGLLFFGGSALVHYWQGVAILVAGVVAVSATVTVALQQRRTSWAVAGSLGGAGIAAALAVLVIAATER